METKRKLGAKVLLCGYPGVGKSHALRTIPEELERYGIFTDQGGISVGAPFCKDFHHLSPSKGDMEAMISFAQRVNTSTVEGLIKGYGGERQNYQTYIDLLQLCNDYIGNEGAHYGSIFEWETDRVLWIDHLSGVTKMAKQLTVGNRPILSLPEYGIVQNILIEFIDTIITSARCHVVFVSHLDVTMNQLTGAKELSPATIGQKLGPTLGINFTDIILAEREGKSFIWQTLTNHDLTLKANHVEWSESMSPNFETLFSRWRDIHGDYTKTPE